MQLIENKTIEPNEQPLPFCAWPHPQKPSGFAPRRRTANREIWPGLLLFRKFSVFLSDIEHNIILPIQWNTISDRSKPNGSSAGKSAAPTASPPTPRVPSSTSSTCSPTPRGPGSTSAIRWATSPRTSIRATSGSRDSTCCTPWVTTHSACPPSSTPSRPGSTPPSRPSATSPATASSSTKSVFRSTGTARCAPATRPTTSGRSGRSSKCTATTTATTHSRHGPSQSSSKPSPNTATRVSTPPAPSRCASRPTSGTPRAKPRKSRFCRTTGSPTAPTRWSTGVRSWAPCSPTTRCATGFRSAAASPSSRSA